MTGELRRANMARGLSESDIDPDPFKQFGAWFQQASAAQLPEANAMTLSTTTRDGRPSARMVLLRGWDERGFVLFTNYESRKGHELAQNPFASLVFFWAELARQIRIEGRVEQVAPEESDEYFRTRPRESQIGAWASHQSEIIPNRNVLDQRAQELDSEFAENVPRPTYWGGYRVIPDSFEFWQSRPGRLHDRLRYTRQEDRAWRIERLSP